MPSTVTFEFDLGDKVVAKTQPQTYGFVRGCYIEGHADDPRMCYHVERNGGSRAVYVAGELRPFDAETDGWKWNEHGLTSKDSDTEEK